MNWLEFKLSDAESVLHVQLLLLLLELLLELLDLGFFLHDVADVGHGSLLWSETWHSLSRRLARVQEYLLGVSMVYRLVLAQQAHHVYVPVGRCDAVISVSMNSLVRDLRCVSKSLAEWLSR